MSKDKQTEISRRDLVKLGVGVASASAMVLSGFQALGQNNTKKKKKGAEAAAKCEMIGDNDPMAKSQSYVADKSKVDLAKIEPKEKAQYYSKRIETEWKDQYCDNCLLMAPDPEKSAPKGFVKCQLFAGKCVAGKGWCKSWAKKVG